MTVGNGTMEQTSRKSVVVLDRHPVVRQGVRRLIESSEDFAVVGDGGTLAESYRLCEALGADILVMDLNVPDARGLV